MNVLEPVSQHSSAKVLAVGHSGERAETGTRGTSAKEADVVMAPLGTRSIGGEVTDTRLATCKRHSSETFPFTVRLIELVDRHGARSSR
jgi:hypothetical protein